MSMKGPAVRSDGGRDGGIRQMEEFMKWVDGSSRFWSCVLPSVIELERGRTHLGLFDRFWE